MPEPEKSLPDERLPEHILGYLSVRTNKDRSVLQEDDLSDLKRLRAPADQLEAARREIRRREFQIAASSEFGFAVVGSPQQWRDLGGKKQEEGLQKFEEGLFTP